MARTSIVNQSVLNSVKVSAQYEIPSYEDLSSAQKETVDQLEQMFQQVKKEDMISICHDLNFNFDACLDKLLALSADGTLNNLWNSSNKKKTEKADDKKADKKRVLRITTKPQQTNTKAEEKKADLSIVQSQLAALEREEAAFLTVAAGASLTESQKAKIEVRRNRINDLRKCLGLDPVSHVEKVFAENSQSFEESTNTVVEEKIESVTENLEEPVIQPHVESTSGISQDLNNAPWNPYVYVPYARPYDPANPVYIPQAQNPAPFLDAESQGNNMQFMGYPLGYPMPVMGQPGMPPAYPMGFTPYMQQPTMAPMPGVPQTQHMGYPFPGGMQYMGAVAYPYPDPTQQQGSFNQQ